MLVNEELFLKQNLVAQCAGAFPPWLCRRVAQAPSQCRVGERGHTQAVCTVLCCAGVGMA